MSKWIFDLILSEVLYPKLGRGLTSTRQLKTIGRQQLGDSFRGVFAINTMVKLNPGECEIVNTDEIDKRGEHWLAFFRVDDTVLVFDSFGRSYKNMFNTTVLKERLGVNRIQDASRMSLQSVLEFDCGQKCLAYLIMARYW